MADKTIKLKDVKVPLKLMIKWSTQEEAKEELDKLLGEAEAELDKHEGE